MSETWAVLDSGKWGQLTLLGKHDGEGWFPGNIGGAPRKIRGNGWIPGQQKQQRYLALLDH